MFDAVPFSFHGEMHHFWTLGGELTLEASELTKILKYVQPGSLRKQITHDWSDVFQEDVDFYLVRDLASIRKYEQEVKGVGPVTTERGYMFLRHPGIMKVLARTTRKELARDLTEEIKTWSFTEPIVDFSEYDVKLQESLPSGVSLNERQFNYDVIQTLLHQLQTFTFPELKELALLAAEEALGRRLPQVYPLLRNPSERSPTKKGSEPSSGHNPEKTKPLQPGALFTEEGFYRLGEIGAKAGDYSSRTAGQAANLAAKARGYSPSDIRLLHLPFNQLVRFKTPSGNAKFSPKFDRAFSNEVISILRSDPQFAPMRNRGDKSRVPNLVAPVDLGWATEEKSRSQFDQFDQVVELFQV